MLPSSLLFRDLVQDRLPCLLLLMNERRGFGGRHRIGIAAERRQLLFQFRFDSNFAQVFAHLVDDRFGRTKRGYQNSPAVAWKTAMVSATVGTSAKSRKRLADATAISLTEPDRAAAAMPE